MSIADNSKDENEARQALQNMINNPSNCLGDKNDKDLSDRNSLIVKKEQNKEAQDLIKDIDPKDVRIPVPGIEKIPIDQKEFKKNLSQQGLEGDCFRVTFPDYYIVGPINSKDFDYDLLVNDNEHVSDTFSFSVFLKDYNSMLALYAILMDINVFIVEYFTEQGVPPEEIPQAEKTECVAGIGHSLADDIAVIGYKEFNIKMCSMVSMDDIINILKMILISSKLIRDDIINNGGIPSAYYNLAMRFIGSHQC